MLHLKIVFFMISFLVILFMSHSNNVTADDTFIRDKDLKVELVVEGLKSPTSMAFLGPEDLLVLEKDGNVLRVTGKNILAHPALNITDKVDSAFERGLIGIAVHPSQQLEYEIKPHKNSVKYAYLFYTEKVTNGTDPINECRPNECNTKQYAANMLYRYDIEDGKLINPQLLVSIALSNKSDFIHVGGQIIIGPDGYVYFSTGDGKTCGNYEECTELLEQGPLNSQTANMKNGANASGRGGILYFKDTGAKAQNTKNIFSDEYPLNFYYAYGIRNSFGIDFDPLTGNLWNTENGPAFGDEINLVRPGFNSGWSKVQGIWPITNNSLLANDPPPGSEKGYFDSNGAKLDNYDDAMFDFGGKGKYSNPEFTWNHTVGVTSIKFLNSDRYGDEYKDDLFVATFNGGFLYHFDLTKDRMELSLKEELSDKIANDDEELRTVALARGFGGITDLEVSPDGLLYILSITEGKIWRLVDGT